MRERGESERERERERERGIGLESVAKQQKLVEHISIVPEWCMIPLMEMFTSRFQRDETA